MYRKVIVSGNVLEVYTYQFPPTPINVDLDDSDGLSGYEKNLMEIGDRKDERRAQTLRDARNNTRRLALMNFNDGDKFLTLTFDPKKFQDRDLYCIDFVDNEFKKFIKRFNYKFQTKLKYIAVRETHKTGKLHFHMLCDWQREFTGEEEVRHFERFLATDVWKHGFVDIKSIDHVDNVGAYLIKYMTKNLSVELFKGKKVYLCSRGLDRPTTYRAEEAEALIKAYKLDNKKEVFTNCYESEYLGHITYKEYNMKRF